MQRALQYAICTCTLFFLSQAQSVGHVDLSYKHEPTVTNTASETKALPGGCEKIGAGIIADGWVQTEDKVPREIAVRVISVNDAKPALGSELLAEVELQNKGAHPITIPWSTDSGLVQQGQDPDARQWGAGTFEFTLKNQDRGQVMLVSMTEWLYSSSFSVRSLLTLQSEQNVTAKVRFKIQNRFEGAYPGLLKEGEWQLFANWHQVDRYWSVKDCKGSNAYYMYDDFYKQTNVPITLHITSPAPSPAYKPAQ